MSTPTILIVEDDVAIRQGVLAALRHGGYAVLAAADGARGAELATSGSVDLVLLDLVLPALDGLEVLRRIRRAEPSLPVIVLTAKGAEEERVAGLSAGADDYVVKPFGVRELLARVEAVLRRSPERPQPMSSLRLGACKAELDRCELRFDDGTTVELTALEADLLRYLARHHERVVSRDELLTRVWQKKPHVLATRSVDMTMARLRKKLRERDGEELLIAVRGRGYRLCF